jgi:hypothetical protein
MKIATLLRKNRPWERGSTAVARAFTIRGASTISAPTPELLLTLVQNYEQTSYEEIDAVLVT